MMLRCSSPGCPNLVPSLNTQRGASVTVLCAFHQAEHTPAPESYVTAAPNPWHDDPLAAILEAMPMLDRIREWNRQTVAVADLVAKPDRVHGIIVEVSAIANTITARELPALAHDLSYVVDLDKLTIDRAALKLPPIPFTTERTEP